MIKGFSILSKSWYGNNCLENSNYIDEITIGLYNKDESTKGECSIRWYNINNKPNVKLEMYYDSWYLLDEYKDLFSILSKCNNITVNEVIKILEDLNFTNITKTTSKY